MAAEQSNSGRSVDGLVAALLVPRVATWPVLLALGALAGQLLWLYCDSVKILAWVAGMAAPFCMMCATAVWTMRDRMDDTLDLDQMSAQEFRAFTEFSNKQRAMSTRWAGVAAMAALFASAPAVSKELADAVWHWMVIGCGMSVGSAVYSYLLSDYWDKQIRAYRNKQKLEVKRREELKSLQSEIAGEKTKDIGRGWTEGPGLITPTVPHH